MKFAERLRELRDAAGLSEAKLAEATGLPFGTIHHYGLSKRKPSFGAVVKIAKALGVDCTAFAGCDDLLKEGPAEQATKQKPSKKKTASKKANRRKSN